MRVDLDGPVGVVGVDDDGPTGIPLKGAEAGAWKRWVLGTSRTMSGVEAELLVSSPPPSVVCLSSSLRWRMWSGLAVVEEEVLVAILPGNDLSLHTDKKTK